MAFNKPCIVCGTLSRQSRCPSHTIVKQESPERIARKRLLYNTGYQRKAQQVRATATQCHLCGGGAKPNDPWEADHVIPGDPNSPLLPAHRTCNRRKSNKG